MNLPKSGMGELTRLSSGSIEFPEDEMDRLIFLTLHG
jgi:hypothetical protein